MQLSLAMAAGALGCGARYLLSGAVQRVAGSSFPWGTLTVNLVGCLAAGFLFAAFEGRWAVGPEARIAIMIGFLGSFTTFSTFALESGLLLQERAWFALAVNLLAQNALGLVAVLLGLALGRAL